MTERVTCRTEHKTFIAWQVLRVTMEIRGVLGSGFPIARIADIVDSSTRAAIELLDDDESDVRPGKAGSLDRALFEARTRIRLIRKTLKPGAFDATSSDTLDFLALLASGAVSELQAALGDPDA